MEIEEIIDSIKPTFGITNEYLTVIIGVLINENEEAAEIAVEELTERIDSESLPCASAFVTLHGYGIKEV